MSWKWRNWYQNEINEEIKGVDSRDKVKHNQRSGVCSKRYNPIVNNVMTCDADVCQKSLTDFYFCDVVRDKTLLMTMAVKDYYVLVGVYGQRTGADFTDLCFRVLIVAATTRQTLRPRVIVLTVLHTLTTSSHQSTSHAPLLLLLLLLLQIESQLVPLSIFV